MIKQLGFNNTNICDVTGLGESTSTVADLVKLLRMLKDSAHYNQIISKNSYLLKSGKKTVLLKNTNKLLSEKVYGKTGTGINAKFCFAGYKMDK
jgi:D-alanyl-D-alanine carboxypeptidase